VTITTKWVDAALASVGPVSATTASPALSKLLHRFDNINDSSSSAALFRLPPAASGAIWAWLQRFVAAQQGVFLVPDRKYRAAGVPCF
jgi:hypothetical protein